MRGGFLHTLEMMDAECPSGVPTERLKHHLLQPGNMECILNGSLGTPLQYACHKGWIPLVRFLLEHGAEPNGNGGCLRQVVITPRERVYPYREMIGLLLSHGARADLRYDLSHDFETAMQLGNHNAVRELIYHEVMPSSSSCRLSPFAERLVRGVRRCRAAATVTLLCIRQVTCDPNVARLLACYVWKTRVDTSWC